MITKQDQIRQLLIDYRATFGSEAGKRVLQDIAGVCFTRRQTYVVERPLDTAFNSGIRDVILYIMRMLEADLDARPSESINEERASE